MTERPTPLRGMAMIAAGNPHGFTALTASAQAYLTTLAPFIGLALFLGLDTGIARGWHIGLSYFLQALIGWLAPPVIAEPLCRRWRRGGAWMLYAVAFNATNLLLLAVIMVVSIAAAMAIIGGLDETLALEAALLAGLIYAIWLQWFTARCTLHISRWQTVLLLSIIQGGTAVLLLPALLG